MKVLVIEDNPADMELIRDVLSDSGTSPSEFEHEKTLAAGISRLARGGFDCILLDLGLPDSQGIETVQTIRQAQPEIPIVVLTGLDDAVSGVQALQEGAQDYLVKSHLNGYSLARSIQYARERKRIEAELIRKNRELTAAEEKLQAQNEELEAIEEELRRNNEELLGTEQILRERTQYLENLITYANAPIVVLDPRFRIIRINRAFELLIGRLDETLVGSEIEALLPEDKREEIMLGMIRQTRGGRPLETTEIPILDARGQIKTVIWSSAVIYDRDGTTALSIIAQGQDITERKRIEEALRLSEERLRLAQEAGHVGVWEWNLITQKSIWTSELEAIYSLDHKSVRTYQDFEVLVHPDDIEMVETKRDSAVAQHKPFEFEFRIRRPQGETRWVSCRGGAVYNEAGQPIRLFGVNIDITDRKRAEEALRESEERFRSILDSSLDALYRRNLLTGHCEYCSPAMEPITGFSANEALAMSADAILERLHPDDRKRISSAKLDVSSGFIQGTVEYRFLCKDGIYRWVSDHFRVICDREGKPLVREGIIRDVDEQKLAEKTLKDYAENLKRSNEDLERFAYIASHDLQEPLRNVVSFSQLLARRYRGKLNADADEYIGYIVEGGKRMQSLVQDLLEYSRVHTKGQEFVPVNCEDVVDRVIQNLHTTIQESDTVIKSGQLPTVLADPSQITLTFQNLIGNAIKFRRNDVQPHISISAYMNNDWSTFSVADNGIGIDPAFHDRIFEIFQRLHTMDKYPGTGVGLAIVKKIIERHGGQIWVESEIGKGSTFYFTLPVSPKQEGGEETDGTNGNSYH
jgi:PAS domain S-box-containing protein